jgi:hypothetical protein
MIESLICSSQNFCEIIFKNAPLTPVSGLKPDMPRSNSIAVTRATAQKEIRAVQGLTNKALMMLQLKLVRRVDLVSSGFISGWVLDRAIKADKSFRDPGVAHRPCRLTDDEDQLLLDLVKIEARTGHSPNARKVRDLVCPTVLSFSITICLYRQIPSLRTEKQLMLLSKNQLAQNGRINGSGGRKRMAISTSQR